MITIILIEGIEIKLISIWLAEKKKLNLWNLVLSGDLAGPHSLLGTFTCNRHFHFMVWFTRHYNVTVKKEINV